MELPKDVKHYWIDKDMDVHKLEALEGHEFVAVSFEWLPKLYRELKSYPTILTLSTKRKVFIIDLIALAKSFTLDRALTYIFEDSNSTFIGFELVGSVKQILRWLPHLNFMKYIKNYIDIYSYFVEIFGKSDRKGAYKKKSIIFPMSTIVK